MRYDLAPAAPEDVTLPDTVHEAEIDLPRLTDLVELTDEREDGRLSLFLPFAVGDTSRSRPRTRARRLLRRVGQAMRQEGIRQPQIDAVLGAAGDLVNDLSLLPAAQGLALFAGEGTVQHFQVPLPVPEMAVLGSRFTVGPLLPLLPLLGTDVTFFVLALNQQDIRLFRGTPQTIDEVELDGHQLAAWQTMPTSPTAQVNAFVADRGGAGNQVVFHGVGGNSVDDRKSRVRSHFRGVDRALREVLGDGRAPLVLAAVRHMQALYGEVNSYPHLLATGIDGSPRDLGPDELHRRAWPLVEPALRRAETEALESYRELHGTGRTVSGPLDTIAAAEQGRVRSLLLCGSACSWQDFPTDDRVGWLDSGGLEFQLECAVLATLRLGGEVFVVPAERMPTGLEVGATLRF